MYIIAVTGSPYGNEFYLFGSECAARARAYDIIENITGNDFCASSRRDFDESDQVTIDNLFIEIEEISFEKLALA